jgi:hypothetical protein
MWCVQVRQVGTGRLLGVADRFETLAGAMAYRAWLEGLGVPAGYELACWEERVATPGQECRKPLGWEPSSGACSVACLIKGRRFPKGGAA